MVTGLDLFKERFAKFTSNYVLIGGAMGIFITRGTMK